MALDSRARWRSLAVASVTVLALSACGTSEPAAAPGSPATSSASLPTSPSASASSTPTDSSTATPTATASPAGADAELVRVRKFGVSFELPKGWISLDAKDALKGTGKNPFVDDLAARLGMTGEQLMRLFATSVQTMSVSGAGAVNGFLTNVNTIGQEGDLNDEQLKLQMATVGAKLGTIGHSTAEAGDVTRMPYDLTSKGVTIRGVALAVHTDSATVVITISASTPAEASRLADRIQRSLKKIPGSGPNL